MKKSHLLTLFVAVLAIIFGAASAQAAKVEVCHIPPGNPDNWHTISVSENALQAHLNHGDLEGGCEANCESLCDDGNACTIDIDSDPDQCICLADPRPTVDCDDGNECTVDSCDSETGACVYDGDLNSCTMCEDGDPETSGEFCFAGACAGGLGPMVECPCEPDIFNGAYATSTPDTCSVSTVCDRDFQVVLRKDGSTVTAAAAFSFCVGSGEAGGFGRISTWEETEACVSALRQDAIDFGLTCSTLE